MQAPKFRLNIPAHILRLIFYLLVSHALYACAAEEPEETDTTGTPAEDIYTPPDDGPLISSLEPGWNEILPEGDTVCSRGSEFAFFVHNGAANNIIIEFEGGGACWTNETCSIADAIFDDSVEEERAAYAAGLTWAFLDHDHEEHPFADWHHIFVPYCTGDVHIGNSVHTYGEGDGAFTINHKGANNVRAVLKWAKENVPNPDAVFVTGCSAGAYGSIFWAPHIIDQYPDTKVYQMGDSGCGVITQSFLEDSFPIWNATEILPTWIESLDPTTFDVSTASLSDIYINLANHYTNHLFSQYTTVADNNQVFYFEAMGGSGVEEWTAQMLASLKAIADASPNFRRFIAPGDRHCILPYDEFYTLEVDGVKLVDWLLNMVSEIPIDEVICTECKATE